jgi:hypothetical protein
MQANSGRCAGPSCVRRACLGHSRTCARASYPQLRYRLPAPPPLVRVVISRSERNFAGAPVSGVHPG